MRSKPLSTVAQASAAESRITGKKFCSHHQGNTELSKGEFVVRNKVRRWICFDCQSKSRSKNE